MTEWFDRQARQAGALTPEQTRKIAAIRAALATSDRVMEGHLISINTFERSAMKAKTGRIAAEWPRRLDGLETETLAARDRLDRLDTGLRAQRLLRASLTELASAFAAWRRGLVATTVADVDPARLSMQRHFANAGRLSRAGFADLKAGR